MLSSSSYIETFLSFLSEKMHSSLNVGTAPKGAERWNVVMYISDSRKILEPKQPLHNGYRNVPPPPPNSSPPVTPRHDSMSRHPLTGFREQAQAHHPPYNSSGREISPSKKPLLDNTHNRQDIHPTAAIRKRNRSQRATIDLPAKGIHFSPIHNDSKFIQGCAMLQVQL